MRIHRHLFPEVNGVYEGGVFDPLINLRSALIYKTCRHPAPVKSRGRWGRETLFSVPVGNADGTGAWFNLSRGKAALPPIRRRATLDRLKDDTFTTFPLNFLKSPLICFLAVKRRILFVFQNALLNSHGTTSKRAL